ncbi:OmpA family protein [Dysgonomonas termitidis]|uniref:OmpA family protein n=1 Tax=Dysgonomonas termitidis TaxID=1516126 RepID=A0ABV9KY24_9BACT
MKNIKDREKRTGQPKIPKICLHRLYPLLLACLMGFQTACAQTGENQEWNDTEAVISDSLLLARYLEGAYVPHELNLWMAGGLSALSYRPNIGKAQTGTGYAFGIGYTRYISRNWGVSTGLEYAFYRGNISIRNVKTSYATHDADSNPIEYRSLVDHYKEYQRSGLLNIPISLIYRMGKDNRYYASLGFKLGIPVYGRYTASGGTVTTSGYYTDYYQEEIWQDDLGFGTFPVRTMEKPLKMGLSYTGTLEAGIKWNIGIGTDLYTGVYIDYGLNNVVRGYAKERFVGYNYENPAEPHINGLPTSVYGAHDNRLSFMEKVSPLAIGIKLKLAFAIGSGDLLAERRRYREMRYSGGWDDIYGYPAGNTDTGTKDRPAEPIRIRMQERKKEQEKEQQQTPIPEKDSATADKPVESITPATIIAVKDTEETVGNTQNDSILSPTGTVITDTTVEIKGTGEQTGTKGCDCGPNLPSIITIGGYKLGQTIMSPEQKAILDGYISLLQANPQAHIEITGHTCNIGTREGNFRAGQKRADMAKDYLISKGISSLHISTSSKGDTEPVSPDNSEESRSRNRRLEVRINK